jgi:uncharacterized damage-inducible protein DinB
VTAAAARGYADPMSEPPHDPAATLLREIQAAFARQKEQVERAVAQLPDGAWPVRLGDDGNSVSVLVRHLSGNLASRWRDPFGSDGEKPDRDRDGEFDDRELEPAAILDAWQAAWAVALDTIGALRPDDLDRTITIRGQPLSVAAALVRSLDHTGHHVGQIVMLAKHLRGPDWATLSLPRRRRPDG